MVNGVSRLEDARTFPRFIPEKPLSISLSDGGAPSVHGNIKNLSELGACVITPDVLYERGVVNVDVRCEHAMLFQAEARVVWRSSSAEEAYGVSFTGLSPFSRQLIRGLGTHPGHIQHEVRPDADSDPDLGMIFYGIDDQEDRFDLLEDPFFEVSMLTSSASEAADGDPHDIAEFSGNLGYFDNTDVLQMLEAARATGVLYVEGPSSGAIELLNGRVCDLSTSDDEAALRLVIARHGRFRFVPGRVGEAGRSPRTITQLVLEAQLQRDTTSG